MAKLLIILFFGLLSLSNQSFCQADSFMSTDSTLKIFTENNKKGIKNASGEVILNPVYDLLGWSDEVERPKINSLGYQKDKLWGLINPEMQSVVSAKYSSLYPLNNELFVAGLLGRYSKTNFYGLIDADGKIQIEFRYRNLIPAGDHLIAAAMHNKKIQFGLINSEGKEILPFQYFQIRFLGSNKYEITENNNMKSLIFLERKPKIILQDFDSISDFKNGVAIIYKNGMQGLISEAGKILLSIKYKKIDWNNGEKIIVTPVNQWEIYNTNIKKKQTAIADTSFYLNDSLLVKNIGDYSELYHTKLKEPLTLLKGKFLGVFMNQFLLKKDNKVFMVNNDSTIENRFFEGEVIWNNNYFIVQKQRFEGKYFALYNAKGKEILADTFKLLEESIALQTDAFWGLYDAEFKEILPALYDEIIPTSTQHFIVKFRGEYGLVDENNNWVFSPKYREIEEIKPGIFKGVNKFLREFIITEDFQVEAKLYYDIYDDFIVESDIEGNSRLVNTDGESISTFFKGKYVGHNTSGILFREAEKLKYYNQEGKKQFQIENYDSVFLTEEEFFPVIKDGQHGFIDRQGLLRVANRYDAVRPYQDEMAAVKIRTHWGFIDRREVLQIQPYFKEVSDFIDGVTFVNYNNKYGLINKAGEYLLEANYDKIEKIGNFYILRKNNKWGAATSKANIIAHPNYQSIEVMGDFLKVKQYDKYRILNSSGNFVLNEEYDQIIYDAERLLFFCKKEAKSQQVFLTDLLKGEEP